MLGRGRDSLRVILHKGWSGWKINERGDVERVAGENVALDIYCKIFFINVYSYDCFGDIVYSNVIPKIYE